MPNQRNGTRRILGITSLAVLAGCATLARHSLDERYGAPDPTRFDAPAAPSAGPSYRADVQPILDRRCVVCHACNDAQCQLKLSAWEGIARGARVVSRFWWKRGVTLLPEGFRSYST